jgi:photosystem II stability/assembly factor-like uncharacterized protein
MNGEHRLYLGTRKGLFRLRSCDGRRSWTVDPPALVGHDVYHAVEDPRDPARVYAAANHMVWGPRLARSLDGGRTWDEGGEQTQSPAFATGSGDSVKAVWYILPGHPERPGEVWVGVEPAALFRSRDWGATWEPVCGLNEHPTRAMWQPGGGGLCLHGIAASPSDPDDMVATISAGGSFRTTDGGTTWTPINSGVRAGFMPDESVVAGHCVHKLVRSPQDPNWLFQQNHCGAYRSKDGGASWQEVTAGLPSEFGFPAAIHPHESQTVYVAPLRGDFFRVFPDGAMAVWRSRDGGDNWEPLRCGLPQRNAYLASFRAAMSADREDAAGIYLGTSTGQVFCSIDEGDSWSMIADYLPPILSVAAA